MLIANKNANTEFEIPVTWQVFDKVTVQANSLEEAYKYVQEHLDDIPLGSDPDYVDASYEISADEVDDCIYYQPISDVVCVTFNCEDLSLYTDSMLFDSELTIAVGKFAYGRHEIEVSLAVRGEVSVAYKGNIYNTPSKFPKTLKDMIRNNPNNWDGPDVYINFNNWFEYIFESDGRVYENDLSKAKPEEILEDMKNIARQYFGISK